MYRVAVNTLLIFIILFYSCKDSSNEDSSSNNDTIAVTDSLAEQPKPNAVTTIYTWVNSLRMREEPATGSPIVATLQEGEELNYEGEKTDFREKINLRGTLYDEPWLKVKTQAGKEGWVYGGGVKFYKVGVDMSGTPYDDCFKLEKDRKITQSIKCFERVRFRELKNNASRVRASNNGIFFKLLDGTSFDIENIGRDTTYKFLYYMKDMGFFVVQENDKSQKNYLLVNDKSGETVSLKGFPKSSPKSNHIVGINADWKSKEAFNGVQILSHSPRGFEVVFEKSFDNYHPTSPKWIDDTTLQITLQEIDNKRKSKIAQLAKNQTDGEWSLDY